MLLGSTKETVTFSEVERDDLDSAKRGVIVPLGGECLIILKENVTTMRAKIVTEEV